MVMVRSGEGINEGRGRCEGGWGYVVGDGMGVNGQL